MCGKLPATLALFAVLDPLHPRTIKPFLPSFLSRRHSCEKRYQALSRFSVLIATESWAGPGNEATGTDVGMLTVHNGVSIFSFSRRHYLLSRQISYPEEGYACPDNQSFARCAPRAQAGGEIQYCVSLR